MSQLDDYHTRRLDDMKRTLKAEGYVVVPKDRVRVVEICEVFTPTEALHLGGEVIGRLAASRTLEGFGRFLLDEGAIEVEHDGSPGRALSVRHRVTVILPEGTK